MSESVVSSAQPVVDVPQIGEMTEENHTENVKLICSNHSNERLKFLLSRIIDHLHEFARETLLTTEEWMAGIEFLTATGQMCSDIRQEFILLSDVLGLSVLVDSLSHPKPGNATIGTLLGPFHTEDAESVHQGESIIKNTHTTTKAGEPLLITGRVLDTEGNPIKNAMIDIWHCDTDGLYDTQYEDRDEPDLRGIYRSDDNGDFIIKCIRPVPYSIPNDGPVGKLLHRIGRHSYRPAHLHFLIEAEGYDQLITALYRKGDPYEKSDAVFGVKNRLIFDLEKCGAERGQKYGMNEDDWYLHWDFILVAAEEAAELRKHRALEVVEKDRRKQLPVKLDENGLPIFDVD